MPSPAGHALAGLAAAWFGRTTARVAVACAIVATLPDLDILFDSHRTYTHSLGGVLIVSGATWLACRSRVRRPGQVTLAVTAAYASHILLDWLGKDSSSPPGLMVLWPLRSNFYISGIDFFGEVSRRYWRPSEFIVGNMKAVVSETLVLCPVLVAAWLVRRRRNVRPW